MANNESQSGGVGIVGILTIVFVVLKLVAGVIMWIVKRKVKSLW